MPKFTMTTLGCKVNQYDGAALTARLTGAGLVPAADGEPCDALVVNTCCVTTTAMRKSRQALRRVLRAHPAAAVLVTGCYADYDPDRLAALLRDAGADPARTVVAGHHADLDAAVRALAGCAAGRTEGRIAHGNPDDLRRRSAAARRTSHQDGRGRGIDRFAGHRRAFVKVQDGCDAFCTYCVVPYTRCRIRSRPPGEVEAECRRLVRAGHREIVLSGVFLGAYGRATAVRSRWADGPAPLAGLVRRVAAIEGLWRVRLSSIAPGDVTDELLEVVGGSPTVAPHLHMPLQSGSRRILRAMNRRYTPDDYRRAVDAVRDALDTPALTTDIIVGFPGEAPADFDATLALAREAGFARIHAFGFSAVPPTAAWRRRHEAPRPDEVKRRCERLAALGRELGRAYRQRLIGRRLEGLVEEADRTGRVRAMTDRYQPVVCDAELIPGRVVAFEIAGAGAGSLRGRAVAPGPACPRGGS
ncbi:MAG: MiaB/RimO family radical SAM methylthiotransferase [Planctomycetota bacterium]